MTDPTGASIRERDPAILLYAQNIVQAPDEWTPYYTRAELLPMAKAYIEQIEREEAVDAG